MATYRVPIYDEAKVQPQAAPSGRMNIQAPAEAFGAGVGRALGEVGQEIARVTDHLDRKRVEESVNELHLVDASTVVGIGSKKGKQALGADPITGKDPFSPILEERKKSVAAIAGKLSTASQKRMFEEVAAKHDADMLGRITGHRDQQQKVWDASVSKGTIITRTQLVSVDAANPEKLTEHFAAMDAAVAALNPGEDVAAIQASYRSKAALGAVQDAVMNNRIVPGNLLDYMTPEDATKAKKLAEESDVEVKALQAREEVYYKDMTPESMESVATSIADGNPKLHKAILHQLRDRAQSDKVTQATYDSDTYSKAVTSLMIEGGNTAQVKAQALGDRALSDEGRAKMAQLVHSVERQRKAEYESDPQAGVKLLRDAYAFATEPNFPLISREAILNDLPRWGAQAGFVMKAWEAANAEGKPLPVPVTAKKAIIAQFDIKPKNEDDQFAFNEAINRAQGDFARERKGKGRYADADPTAEEWTAKIKFYYEPRTYKHGFFGGSVKESLSTATPEQVQGMAETIPADDKTIIVGNFNMRGVKTESISPMMMIQAHEVLKAKRSDNPAEYKALYERAFPGKKFSIPTSQVRR